MWPFRRPAAAPPRPIAHRRVAVLLNRNAQRVTPALLAHLGALVPAEDLFVTASTGEARAAVAAIVARGHDVLCTGGGDGTFVRAVTDLIALAPPRLPALLALRLGSGNAIADVCGASPPTPAGLAADLARAAGDEPPAPLHLLRADGRLGHSAGVGLDAAFNDDLRVVVKRGVGRGLTGPLFHGLPGIALAALTRTLPRLFRRPRFAVRIVNTGAPAHRLDERGEPTGEPIPTGAVVHAVPIVIASASTVATYGRGLRYFPFTERLTARGQFQLRVADLGLLEVIPNLPRIFAGTYHAPGVLWDYAVSSVRFELERPAPVHIGGELEAPTDRFTLSLAAETVPVLRAAG